MTEGDMLTVDVASSVRVTVVRVAVAVPDRGVEMVIVALRSVVIVAVNDMAVGVAVRLVPDTPAALHISRTAQIQTASAVGHGRCPTVRCSPISTAAYDSIQRRIRVLWNFCKHVGDQRRNTHQPL